MVERHFHMRISLVIKSIFDSEQGMNHLMTKGPD